LLKKPVHAAVPILQVSRVLISVLFSFLMTYYAKYNEIKSKLLLPKPYFIARLQPEAQDFC